MAQTVPFSRMGRLMPTDLLNGGSVPPFQFESEDGLLTKRETGQYLRVSDSTLERWEKLSIGPKPIRLETGRVRYRWPEVRAAARGGGMA